MMLEVPQETGANDVHWAPSGSQAQTIHQHCIRCSSGQQYTAVPAWGMPYSAVQMPLWQHLPMNMIFRLKAPPVINEVNAD